eukprot:m.491981 g.491981  ORF g.491981 m.491981 type:complete len:241 (+) comp57273_c0_seq11:45-767(+)
MHTNKTRGEILRSTSKKKKRRKEDEHETPESHQHTKSTEPRSKVKSFHAEPWRRCTQKIIRCSLELSHHAEDGIVAADGRAVLFVLGLGVADLVVLGRGCNEAASNPHRVALQLVAHHLHVNLLGLLARDGLATLEAVVDMALDLLLQALLQVLEHRRASREHNVLTKHMCCFQAMKLSANCCSGSKKLSVSCSSTSSDVSKTPETTRRCRLRAMSSSCRSTSAAGAASTLILIGGAAVA